MNNGKKKRSVTAKDYKNNSRAKFKGDNLASDLLPFELIHSDALAHLRKLRANSISSVITSPPYWSLRHYGIRGEIGAERLLKTYLDHLRLVFTEVYRVIKSDGVMWLVIGDAYTSGNRNYRDSDSKYAPRGMNTRPKTPKGLKAKDLIGLPWRVAFLLQTIGWHLRTEIIWQKSNAMPESVKDRPQRNHEYLFLLSKNRDYFFDRKVLDNGFLEDVDTRRSVWSVSVGSDKAGHKAAFPLRLITPCLLSSSKPGDLVLDPFVGSGTVGVACIQNYRRFIGIDLNPEYISLATNRLTKSFERFQVNGGKRKWARILNNIA